MAAHLFQQQSKIISIQNSSRTPFMDCSEMRMKHEKRMKKKMNQKPIHSGNGKLAMLCAVLVFSVLLLFLFFLDCR